MYSSCPSLSFSLSLVFGHGILVIVVTVSCPTVGLTRHLPLAPFSRAGEGYQGKLSEHTISVRMYGVDCPETGECRAIHTHTYIVQPMAVLSLLHLYQGPLHSLLLLLLLLVVVVVLSFIVIVIVKSHNDTILTLQQICILSICIAKFGNPAMPFAKEATEWTDRLIGNKVVEVQLLSRDQYNRVVGSIRVRYVTL